MQDNQDDIENKNASFEIIESKDEMRSFLEAIREQLSDQTVAPVYALSALNYVLNQPNLYDLFDQELKEIAQQVWLHIRKSGVQHDEPPLLARSEEN